MLNITDKLILELPHKHLELFLILDHPIYGYHQKNVNFHRLVISTDITILLKVQHTSITELNSISLTDQEQFLDLLDKIQSLLQDWKLKKPYLVKSLLYMESASWPPNLTVFWEWHGHQFLSMVFHLSSIYLCNRDKLQEKIHSLSI